MPSCPTLTASRQLAHQLGTQGEELCVPDKLPSLLQAVRTVPDPRAPHLVTHPLPMLLGLVACALLCGVRSVRGVIRWAHGQGLGDQPFDRIDGLLCLFGMYKAVTDSSDDVGAVYRPEGSRFRVGVAAVSHIKARVVPEGDDGVVMEGGYVLPREVVRPWEARFGIAYQLGPRPLNRRYELPPDPSAWVRAQDREARCARIAEQLAREAARGVAPREHVSPEERMLCPSIEQRPSDPEFWEEERIRREEERATRDTRIERERKRIKHQRWIDYEILPRRYFLVSADLVVIGGVRRSVGIDGFLDQELRLHTERPSFLPRLGVEGEPWPRRLKLRAGAYVEPGRNAGVSARMHFTAGFDVRLFVLEFTGPVNPWDIRVGATMDLARDYSDLGLSLGFWY